MSATPEPTPSAAITLPADAPCVECAHRLCAMARAALAHARAHEAWRKGEARGDEAFTTVQVTFKAFLAAARKMKGWSE